jgi:hypothetical protein
MFYIFDLELNPISHNSILLYLILSFMFQIGPDEETYAQRST